MIRVTKFDGTAMMINVDSIQSIEHTPDTLITLTTGDKFIVLEKLEEVVAAFQEYKLRFVGLTRLKKDVA